MSVSANVRARVVLGHGVASRVDLIRRSPAALAVLQAEGRRVQATGGRVGEGRVGGIRTRDGLLPDDHRAAVGDVDVARDRPGPSSVPWRSCRTTGSRRTSCRMPVQTPGVNTPASVRLMIASPNSLVPESTTGRCRWRRRERRPTTDPRGVHLGLGEAARGQVRRRTPARRAVRCRPRRTRT